MRVIQKRPEFLKSVALVAAKQPAEVAPLIIEISFSAPTALRTVFLFAFDGLSERLLKPENLIRLEVDFELAAKAANSDVECFVLHRLSDVGV